MKTSVLIIEDDLTFGNILSSWFRKNGFDVHLVSQTKAAQKLLLNKEFSLILSDYRLPDGNGLELLEWIRNTKEHFKSPFIIMTSYAETPKAVKAIKLGAFDYLEKPIHHEMLKQKVEQALSHTHTNHPSSVPRQQQHICGNSALSLLLEKHINLVAPTSLSVVIRGESGTGKEVVANLIHQKSLRHNAPFVAIDCGSLSHDIAPSELFGHIKGAFTSAIDNKKGAFEEAHGGTLFLDEIGNLSYQVQIQLLRAVQERKIRPVGAVADIPVDVRLIVATNENLEQAIKYGDFREDLYHRLNEFTIEVPSLRERAEDIPLFAKFFLSKANEELNKKIIDFSPEVMFILQQYTWPGNLRELKNTIRRIALFTDNDTIVKENIPEFLYQKTSAVNENSTETSLVSDGSFSLKKADEKSKIIQALRATNGNKTRAAQLLQIDRKTLYNKISQYGISL